MAEMFNTKETRMIDIIYKKVKGEVLSAKEQKIFNKWIKRSAYYHTLMDDIESDENLRNKLMSRYITDKLDFWTEVITYRTALHGDKPKRKRFFSFFNK